MKLDPTQKLVLTMLADVHDHLGINTVDTKLIKNAIDSDNAWALSWKFQGLVDGQQVSTPPEVDLVVRILEMWEAIELAWSEFDASQQAQLKQSVGVTSFYGFDGNNEWELLRIARLLINDMHRFRCFAGRIVNSHCPTIERYQAMLRRFEPIRGTLSWKNAMSYEQVQHVLKA